MKIDITPLQLYVYLLFGLSIIQLFVALFWLFDDIWYDCSNMTMKIATAVWSSLSFVFILELLKIANGQL